MIPIKKLNRVVAGQDDFVYNRKLCSDAKFAHHYFARVKSYEFTVCEIQWVGNIINLVSTFRMVFMNPRLAIHSQLSGDLKRNN